jgi:hypothetical protein
MESVAPDKQKVKRTNQTIGNALQFSIEEK